VSVIEPSNAVQSRNGNRQGDVALRFVQVSSPIQKFGLGWFVKVQIFDSIRVAGRFGSGVRISDPSENLFIDWLILRLN
jgi:hypothetical protein